VLQRIIYRVKSNQLLVKGLIDTNYYMLAQLSAKVIAVLIVPLVARLLSVEDFATYDLFILASSFISLVATLGIDSGMAIKITENQNNPTIQASLLKTVVVIATGILVITWLGSFIVLFIGWMPDGYSMVFVNSLFVYAIVYQYNYNVFSFVRWVGKAKQAAWINFTTYSLGILLGVLFLFFWNAEVQYYIFGLILGNVIGNLLSTWIVKDFIFQRGFSLQAHEFKDLMKLSLPYVPTYLSNYAMQFVDRLLITSAFGMEGLGLYAIVNRIAQIPTFAIQLIANGFQPVIFSNYQNSKGKSLAQLIFNLYWIVVVPAAAASLLFGEDLIMLFGGEKYMKAVTILPYLIVSTLMLGCFYVFGYGYAIKRKTFYVTIITISVVGLIYGLSQYFISANGINGVAIATFASTAVGACAYVTISEYLYSFGYKLRWMYISIVLTGFLLFIFVR
jgi:O-antigen/teichoic acid export membrane protein